MKPRVTLIALGVDDLEKAVDFYRNGLGLPTRGIVGTGFEYGAVAFFDLQARLKLALWPRQSVAHDTGVPKAPRGLEPVDSRPRLKLGHVRCLQYRSGGGASTCFQHDGDPEA